MKFKTVCYLLVQLMHCRKMFKAEIPFSNVMTCEDDDKVCVRNRSLFKKEKRLHVGICNYRVLPGEKNPFDVFVCPFVTT